MDGVQFAFHYVNPTHETGPLAVDNVKLTAPGGSSETVTLTTTTSDGATPPAQASRSPSPPTPAISWPP